jgi:hypothetical protein
MNARILGLGGAGCGLGARETTGALVEGRSVLGGAPHATSSATTIVATPEHGPPRIITMIPRPARESPWVHRRARLRGAESIGGAGGCNWLKTWLAVGAFGPGNWLRRKRVLFRPFPRAWMARP